MKHFVGICLLTLVSMCCAIVASAQQPLDINGVRDLTLDSLDRANQARPISGSTRRGNNPVLFLVGNSTMRCGTLGNGQNGQWGWGHFVREWFDADKITVENHALGGTSPRTFYRRLWPDVLKGVQKGDFVVLELGHNDNGPLDYDRARSSLRPALADDSLLVTIRESGQQEMVYTFGGYIRRFVAEIRDKGATPILLTLTPRNAYTDANQTVIDRKLDSFTPWIKALADELHTPCIDLNDLSATKLETYGVWKTNYHFFLDRIHSSIFGARMNAASFAEGLATTDEPSLQRLRAALRPRRQTPKRNDGRPRVFLTGDSTVKNADSDKDGMWGWGAVAYDIFDPDKCVVVNAAKAGRSTRTFLEEGRWDAVYEDVQPGDYVLIQFGHNDIGPIDNQKERGTIATAADTCHVYRLASSGQYRVAYSFGFYLKKFIGDVRERGGIPVLVSLTPRNEWTDGHIERRNESYGRWYREVAEETGCLFIDLHNISADRFDKIGPRRASRYFCRDHTHSSLRGARHTARCIARGIKASDSPLGKLLR